MRSRWRIDLLADYIRRVRKERKLSTTDVEMASGGAISDAYVTRIENGYVKNISMSKLQALADGLGVSEDEIFDVARGKPIGPLSPTDFRSALEALGVSRVQSAAGLDLDNLTAEDQQEIIAMVEAMVSQKLKRRQQVTDTGKKGRK